MDFAFFPSKPIRKVPIGYLSIKLGYKYVFSETKTGFYLEPSAGYCRVVFNDPSDWQTQTSYGDGVAAALEAVTVSKWASGDMKSTSAEIRSGYCRCKSYHQFSRIPRFLSVQSLP
jgi:hypothetical protein